MNDYLRRCSARRASDFVGHLGRRLSFGIDHKRSTRLVNRRPLGQYGLDFRLAADGRQVRAAAGGRRVGRDADRDRVDARREPDDRSGSLHHGPAWLRGAPRRRRVEITRLVAAHRSATTAASRSRNAGFAVVGEDRRDRLAGPALDLVVGVDPVAAQPLGQQPGDGRLARAAVADQEDGVRCVMSLNRKRSIRPCARLHAPCSMLPLKTSPGRSPA